jgi:glucose-6-phosphate isomerase
MLKLDTHALTPQVVGAQTGIDLDLALTQYGTQLSAAIDWLWHEPGEAGQWRDWLNLDEQPAVVQAVKAYAQSIQGQFDALVVVGIGGSALGPMAMVEALLPSYWNERTLAQRNGAPKIYFVDNVDPDKLFALFDVLDVSRTLVNVITKSGTTSETMAGFMWLKAELETKLGVEKTKQHLVFTTDPVKGLLRQIAQTEGIVAFDVPPDVGGRFSLFSPVGLLPAAILGIDIEAMLGGMQAIKPSLQSQSLAENPAALGALIQWLSYQQGRHISVLMPYSAKLALVADWYVQLWAESLGKKFNRQGQIVHEGPTPLKAVGVSDQHAQVQLFNEGPFNKIITFVRVGAFGQELTIPNAYPDAPDLNYLGNQTFGTLLQAEADATRDSLAQNGRPSVSWVMPQLDPAHFAQLLYVLEVQTGLMGHLLGIDPFDQPGVELGKKLTYALMGRPGFESYLKQPALQH